MVKSMNLDRFTTKAQQALQDAQRLAHGYDHQELDGEHVLLALI
jgi:ATP-dependent Clp protease ATP-binding subunit ClpB